MNSSSLWFCSGVIVASLLVAAIAFPFASLPSNVLTASHTATPAEEVPDLDLGEFGVVSVSDLVTYYIENPPEPISEGTAAPKRVQHFGGC